LNHNSGEGFQLPSWGSTQSAIDFVVGVAQTFRAGDRWQELVDAVGAREILLVGHQNVDPPGTDVVDVATVTETGTDEEFTHTKESLLIPELQLGETYRRLGGICEMMVHYVQVDGNQKDTTCGHRDSLLEQVDTFPVPQFYTNSEPAISPAFEIQRRIEGAFGKPDLPLNRQYLQNNAGDPKASCVVQ
jgi:hypothetical protein